MENQDKRLPEDADINKKKEDVQNKNQEEYDDRSKQQLDENAREEQEAKNQSEEDSQSGNEKLVPPEKEKQTGEWDKVDRQFPNLRK